MFSLLLTPLLGILSAIVGAGTNYMLTSLRARIRQQELLFKKAGLAKEDRDRASELPKSEVGIVRPLIAISVHAAFIFILLYAMLHPYAQVVIPHVVESRSFWSFLLPFGSDSAKIIFLELPMSVITIPMFQTYVMVMSFYFGSGGINRVSSFFK